MKFLTQITIIVLFLGAAASCKSTGEKNRPFAQQIETIKIISGSALSGFQQRQANLKKMTIEGTWNHLKEEQGQQQPTSSTAKTILMATQAENLIKIVKGFGKNPLNQEACETLKSGNESAIIVKFTSISEEQSFIPLNAVENRCGDYAISNDDYALLDSAFKGIISEPGMIEK